MNAARIAEHREAHELPMSDEPLMRLSFDLIVDTPQGVARLRELILSLAVRGKLVSQHEDDRPAVDLVQRLSAEKARLIESGKIRPRRRGESDGLPEVDYQLPRGWVAARLSDLAWPQAGFAFKSSGFNEVGAGLPLIRIRDVGVSNPTTFFTGEYRDEFVVRRGDWLISMDGDFRVASWQGPTSLLNQRVTRLIFFDANVPPLYICLALQQELRKLQGTKAYTTVDHLSGAQIASCVIPLPPLAEQARIVARVEELMQLCDALETHGRLQDEQHARLVTTLFDALVASESAHALTENWQRIAAHFDLLLDRPDAVDALEQTILQLAVRGLLVPQDPTDESASELLKRIRARRAKHCGAAAVKSRQGASRAEPVFNLPSGWEPAGWLDVCVVGGGATPSKGNASYWNGDIPWVSPKDMKVDVIDDSQDHVSPKALEETRLPLVARNSLLVVVRGMILAHSFPVAVTTREVTLNQDMKSLTPYLEQLSDFLALVLKGFKPEILGLVARSTHGTCKLESEKLFGFTFGLPPLAEQHRIVARVRQLRLVCSELRERLQQARTTQSSLADALVNAAVQSPAC